MTTREQQLEAALRELVSGYGWQHDGDDSYPTTCGYCYAEKCWSQEKGLFFSHRPFCPVRRAQELLTPGAAIQ